MEAIEFYYDFGSPKSYFVHKLLPGIAEKHSVTVVWKPMLLGGVFKLTNNQSPVERFKDVHGKLAYDKHETDRFVKRHNLSYQPNPHFPIMTIGVMRGAIYTAGTDFDALYRDAVFKAIWEDQQKLDDPDVIRLTLISAGLPADEIMAATQTAEVKSRLIDVTNEAVSRGIFGAPTLFLGEEMFFGKESLWEIEYILRQQKQ
jgi:2-hydroxychromene-2-carboxylate isomerase